MRLYLIIRYIILTYSSWLLCCLPYKHAHVLYKSPCYASSLRKFIIRSRVLVTFLSLSEHLFIYEGHSISITELSISKFVEPRWNVDWSSTFDPGQEDMGWPPISDSEMNFAILGIVMIKFCPDYISTWFYSFIHVCVLKHCKNIHTFITSWTAALNHVN